MNTSILFPLCVSNVLKQFGTLLAKYCSHLLMLLADVREGGSGSTDAWQLHDLDYWSMTQRVTAVQPGAKSVTIKVGSEAPVSPGVPTGVNIVLVRAESRSTVGRSRS